MSGGRPIGRRCADGTWKLAVRCAVLGPGEYRGPTELVWGAGGRLLALRRPTQPVADLCALPGLVNAHSHLQIAPLAGAVRQFLPWVRAVMAARAHSTPRQLQAMARSSARALLAEGVAAVGEIDSSGTTPAAMRSLPLGGRCYQELTGFHLTAVGARALVRSRWQPARPGLAAGLSPHAPYSVSPALFAAARQRTRWLAVHCAELPEEQEFLRRGTGPFAELLAQLGRLPAGFRAPGMGAVRWLEQLGLLRRGTLLVHCQELERGDAARIQAGGSAIAVCPGTMAWFGRAAPPVPRWLALGIPVALGTDSAASTESFSLRSELAAAARLWPALAPAQLLAMVTTDAALAIGCPARGRLRRGGPADFQLVPAGGDAAAALLPAWIHHQLLPVQVVVGGRVCGLAEDLRR